MMGSGIKASTLIAKLRQAIKEHGYREVWAGGTDYPEGVAHVAFQAKGDSYRPEKCFVIR